MRPLRIYPNVPLTADPKFKKVHITNWPFMDGTPLMIRTHTLDQKFQKVRN
jgi:hypothetical protein